MLNRAILCATLGLAVSASAVEKKKIDFVVGVDGDFKAAMSKAASSGASESNHFVISSSSSPMANTTSEALPATVTR